MFKFFTSLENCFSSPKGCGWVDVEFFVTSLLKSITLIGMFVAVCMVSYAGLVLFRGFGDAAARSKAKHIFMSVVIGLVILFGAYFIIDLIMTKLVVTNKIRSLGI